MSTFKKCKIVMLSTNEPSKIGNLATYQKRSLAKVIKEGINPIGSTVQFWNLYIISDDEIKENNTHFYNPHSGQLHISGNHTDYIAINKNGCKKIIATTDESLYFKDTNKNPKQYMGSYISMSLGENLPQPSQQFIQKYIEEYNKGNIITDVLVEYEYLLDDRAVLPYWNLKVNTKENTITIKKLKETYNKEELCQILEKYTSFLWSEVGIHYPISLGNDARDKFINCEL